MRRNHKLESELAEEIVGYVIVNTDDYFAAEKQLEPAQQTNNSAMVQLLCDCQDVICHSVFLDDKGHSVLMDRINAVVAQLNQ